MYKNCIFDLYGTLVDIHTNEKKEELWEKLAMLYRYYGADYETEELRTMYAILVKGKQKKAAEAVFSGKKKIYPEIKLEEVFQELYLLKNVKATMEQAVYTGQMFRILSTEYIRLYEGTAEMLKALQDNGKKIYLLSNAQRIFTEYEIRALGLEPFFEKIYLSSEYGWQKPDLRFYNILLAECQLSVKESVMVGNDGVCDIQGAKEAGLSTVYIHSNISPDEPLPKADHVLKKMDMEKLTKILLECV